MLYTRAAARVENNNNIISCGGASDAAAPISVTSFSVVSKEAVVRMFCFYDYDLPVHGSECLVVDVVVVAVAPQ